MVLLGEHLGRRHQRALVPALHGGQQRGDGDDGLARADVALQQPVHRVGGGEVGVDLGDHPLLGGGEREAERGVEALHQLAVDLVAQPDGVALHRPLAHDEHELHAQQLVERQPPPGLLLVGDRVRQVDVLERRLPGRRARGAGAPSPAPGRRARAAGPARARSRPTRPAPTW